MTTVQELEHYLSQTIEEIRKTVRATDELAQNTIKIVEQVISLEKRVRVLETKQE